jgi:hypothetical protein
MANNVMPAASDDRQGLYEQDYYSWALEQTRALKEHRTEELDWENLAEEIEDLGRSERRKLRNRLKALLAHLLKWQFQRRRRTRSWEVTIAVQRAEIRQHLRDNPGLGSLVPVLLADAYETARIEVATCLAGQQEPLRSCPWSFEQLMVTAFVQSKSC